MSLWESVRTLLARPTRRARKSRRSLSRRCRHRLAVELLEDRTLPSVLNLAGSTFFGGAGDQRGTGIAITGGAAYISGNIQPENQTPGDTALVLKYGLPAGPSPVWSRSFGFGSAFFGITATNEGVYPVGYNYSLSSDPVGGKEVKSIAAKFATDGSSAAGPGGSIWVNTPNFYGYSGVENFTSATAAVVGGSTFLYAAGHGQPFSYAGHIIGRFDTAGNLLRMATDPFALAPPGGSDSQGVTVLGGNIYAAGQTGWTSEGDLFPRPALWKYNSNLDFLARFKDTSLGGAFFGVTASGGALYAVGLTFTPNVANSENYLIQKYDEAGNRLWSTTSGGANTDSLKGVVTVGSRLFAVGHTRSEGAGGADAVILEINPTTGAIISQTLFGGAQDDFANGVATDGTDLYVVGESRSFAQGGNTVGQNDVVLLRYVINRPPFANAGGSNGLIAFTSERDGKAEIYVMNPDGSGQTRLTNNPADDSNPAWSPDGSKIVFTSTRDGNSEIYVMNADGSAVTRLTNNAASEGYADWSPDGNKIAFISNRDGNFEIYVMNADGSGQTRLTNNSTTDHSPAWSPDGTRIVFVSDRDGGGNGINEIYVMNADGSGQTRLTNSSADEQGPGWSPDGGKIAFTRGTSGSTNSYEIYVMNADGSGQTQLTNNTAGDGGRGWSPDGAKIAFGSNRDGSPNEIYVMNADGSGQTRLTPIPFSDFEPDWQRVPYTVAESGNVTLTGSGSDPDGDPLTYAWDLDNNGTFETPGQSVTFSAAGRDGPSTQTVRLRVTDPSGASAVSTGFVNITNVAPSNVSLSLSASTINEGGSTTLSGTFTDPGTPDTHTVTINWGDGSANTVLALTGGQRNFSAPHTYVDNPSGMPSGQYTISVTVTDDDGAVSSNAPSGLLSWWKAEGNALDSGNGNHGTPVNGAMFAAGKVGQAFSFNGTNHVATGTSSLPSGNSAMTIEGWFYRTAAANSVQYVASWGSWGSTGQNFAVGVYSNNQVFMTEYSSGHDTFAPTSYSLNAWHHVAATYDGLGTNRLYLDGVLVASKTVGAINVTRAAAAIGADPVGSERWQGLVDEVAVYNRALSAPEIQAIFSAGSIGKGPAITTVTVNNVAPNVAITGAPTSSPEATAINLGSTVTDPGSADTHSYAWSVTKNGSPYASGAAANFSFTPDDNGTYVVTLTVTDDDGGVGSDSKTIAVSNVAPTASIAGPSDGVRGQPRTFTFTANDPSPADQAANFTFTITWGDGSSQTVTGPSGTQVDHVYAASGSYTVQMTATDKDGGISGPATHSITISAVGLQNGTLAAGGTAAGDSIIFQPVDALGNIRVTINGVNQGTFKPTNGIAAFGQAGNDTIRLLSANIGGTTVFITVPAVLSGGDGNDGLDASGSTANNILLGGAGNDGLLGGSGRDLLIGGAGQDGIAGGGGDDLLIAGFTAFDANLTALNAIRDEWASPRDYATRIANLRGTGSGPRLNGNYFLKTDGPERTVFDDGVQDFLFGGAGQDWFFANVDTGVLDTIFGLEFGELVDDSD